MQTTDRQTTTHDNQQLAEQQPARGPQPIDAALLQLISGGGNEPQPPAESPKGGW